MTIFVRRLVARPLMATTHVFNIALARSWSVDSTSIWGPFGAILDHFFDIDAQSTAADLLGPLGPPGPTGCPFWADMSAQEKGI